MNHQKISIATRDERGTIADILYKTEINHAAIVETHLPGVIRGNHYHKIRTQHIFLMQGSLRYWYQPMDKSQPVQSILLKEYEMITTPPLEVHAVEMIEASQLIEFSQGLIEDENYEMDTFRDIVILTLEMLSK